MPNKLIKIKICLVLSVLKKNLQNVNAILKGLYRKLQVKVFKVASASTSEVKATDGQEKVSASTEHTTFWNIYTSIEELTLDRFIECSVTQDENYEPLIKDKSKEVNKENLRLAWLLILSQYYEVKDDMSVKEYIEMQSLLEAKIIRINRIQKLIDITFEQFFDSPCIDVYIQLLKEEGYEHLQFTAETYIDDLKSIANSEKTNLIDIFNIKEELKKKDNKNVARSRKDDYYNMLLALRKHTKIYYKANKMTVYEFALECKRLEQEIEQLNQQYGEHR